MKVFVNQIEVIVEDRGMTLSGLLEFQGINPKGIAVAIDNRIVGREEWCSTTLCEGARVVVIQATYGG